MKRELFKFIESIPANAGYPNYEYFEEGAIVFVDEDFPWKYCILCDENGEEILDDDEESIYLDWRDGFSDYPIWEDKLIPYKEVEIRSLIECDIQLHPDTISIKDFLEQLKDLPDNSIIHLDETGVFTEECLKKYGNKAVVLLEKGKAKLIAVPIEESITPDINELFNSLDNIEHLTINFHNHA